MANTNSDYTPLNLAVFVDNQNNKVKHVTLLQDGIIKHVVTLNDTMLHKGNDFERAKRCFTEIVKVLDKKAEANYEEC